MPLSLILSDSSIIVSSEVFNVLDSSSLPPSCSCSDEAKSSSSTLPVIEAEFIYRLWYFLPVMVIWLMMFRLFVFGLSYAIAYQSIFGHICDLSVHSSATQLQIICHIIGLGTLPLRVIWPCYASCQTSIYFIAQSNCTTEQISPMIPCVFHRQTP